MVVFIQILLLAVLAGSFAFRRKLGHAAPALMAGAAIVSVVLVIANFGGGASAAYSAKLELLFEKACGHHFGRRVAADHPSGGEVLLIQHVPAYLGEAGHRAQQEGLREGLGEADWSLSLATVDLLAPTTDAGIDPKQFDAARFNELLAQHAGVSAVVSLVGFPHCAPRDLQQPLPPLYVYADWGEHAAIWSRADEVRAVVLPKAGGGRPSGKNDLDVPLDDLFAQRYDEVR